MYPYGCGVYQLRVNYPQQVFEQFVNSRFNLQNIQPNCSLANSTIGWTQWYRKDRILSVGAWNEQFVSWGCEDNEFYFRVNSLGLSVARINGYIWHLEHSRTANSWWNNPMFASNDTTWQWIREQDQTTIINYLQQLSYIKERGIHVGI